MSFLSESQELPLPIAPSFLFGAASPLWGYFTGVAAAGVAWWWMSRLARWNLEALTAAAGQPSVASLEAAEEAAFPAVGGEAAPISPVLEALAEPVADPEPALPVEPATFAAPELTPEPEAAAPKPRKVLAAPPTPDA
ncbi:hypothetical protein ACO2Q0_12045 [Phenylobacterium sp. VNQ135]|uniref:hypothetical protein n=1 Tax=Phenylobacterium sp. VNQ135 TaxID=3400922 RepID=UPI003C0A93E6